MKPIVDLALRTEYSFRQTYGKMEDIVTTAKTNYIGVADINNTFSHVLLEKECKKKGINPIFGVRLEVLGEDKKKVRGAAGPLYTFIARNNSGLFEINKLVTQAWENFYYKPMIFWSDVQDLSNDVIVISDYVENEDLRLDYVSLSPSTPSFVFDEFFYKSKPKVYLNNNFFITPDDRKVYQLMAGSTKRGDEYHYKFDTKRAFQHILTTEEFYRIYKNEEAIENTYKIAEQCHVTLPKAKMVKYNGNKKMIEECKKNAIKKGIDLANDEKYKERFEREIGLIIKKEFVDYFMIVSDMIQKAKKTMFVGPSRGSSAGSLVCYLLGITEIDPIKFDLIFERFIDITREDLPDIDIDFPDDGRESVIKDTFKIYGKENVCHISNINKFAAKSALEEVGIALRVPRYEMDILKDSIVDRSGGDARAKMAVLDTLMTTDVGKDMLYKYPALRYAEKVQGHATHAGKHAAGIIVCNDDLCKYGSINSREGSIMMDKKGAEYLNLLKIDVLGLRTLSILQECAKLIGMDYKKYYTLPLDDPKAYKIFQDMRLNGIFQFEGGAMRMLCEAMGVENFNDIFILTALARPGPLHSGGANKFVERRTGRVEVEYICDHPSYIEVTKETLGVIVYQEQLMNLCKLCGNMTWEDVSAIRKAASKTMGKAFFDKYREKFLTGTRENKIPDDQSIPMWENMITFGSWGMNKSHTVSYGHISYWCAYMKANFPLEFTVANLRHSKSEDTTLKILRDAFENEGIEYLPVDPDESELDWSVKDGKLVGGLININGVGEKKALEIIQCREGKKKWTPSMVRSLMDPKTPYDILYPCKHLWGDIYQNPREYGLAFPPSLIGDIKGAGTYVVIGQVKRKDLRDLNEYNELMKRGGKRYETENKTFKLLVEDDTGQIHCSISRKNFERLSGQVLSETLIEDESWVIIKGKVNEGWRVILIEQIFDLKNL
jgi:DNA polymerase III alpha subunit